MFTKLKFCLQDFNLSENLLRKNILLCFWMGSLNMKKKTVICSFMFMFLLLALTLPIKAQATYTLTIGVNNSEWGTTNPAPKTYTYDANTSVTVNATPYNGYYLDHWELNGSWISPDLAVIVMDNNYNLTAVFLPSSSNWVLISHQGNWISSQRTSWQTADDNVTGKLVYFYNNNLPLTYWVIYANGYVNWHNQVSSHYNLINMTLTNGTDAVYIMGGWANYWITNGQYDQTLAYASKLDNHSDYEGIGYRPKFLPIRMDLVRTANDTLTTRFIIYSDSNLNTTVYTWERNYTLSESFFETAKLYMTIDKISYYDPDGCYASGQLIREILVCDGTISSGMPTEAGMTWYQYLGWAIWQSLTGTASWFSETVHNVYPYFGFILDAMTFMFTFIGGVLWSFVHVGLPFLPIIVIFWLLDATVTSVQDGNLQPLGNAFMTIYDFIRGVIQAIVNIASTIWEYIKIW